MLLGINDQRLLILISFGFVGGGVYFNSLGFAGVGLPIACDFVGITKFLGMEFFF